MEGKRNLCFQCLSDAGSVGDLPFGHVAGQAIDYANFMRYSRRVVAHSLANIICVWKQPGYTVAKKEEERVYEEGMENVQRCQE